MKFLLPLLFALAACDDRPRQWDAFIYPGPGLLEFERIAGFKTFELCQQAAIDRIQSLPDPDAASYECGYMCRYDPQMDINICKETRD